MVDVPVAAAPRQAGAAPLARRSRVGWTVVALSSLAIVGFAAIPYALASLDALAVNDTGLANHYATKPTPVQVVLYTHIVSAAFALLLGPWQFVQRLRRRWPRVHRLNGRLYLCAVAVGAASGLALAPFSQAGMVGFFGFGGLAILWALTGWRGYRAIRGGDLDGHRAWMMRGFALTYAAVMLRTWLVLLIAVQVMVAGAEPDLDAIFDNAYAAVPFLCWLPNLLVAEWLIRRRGLPSYRLSAGSRPPGHVPGPQVAVRPFGSR